MTIKYGENSINVNGTNYPVSYTMDDERISACITVNDTTVTVSSNSMDTQHIVSPWEVMNGRTMIILTVLALGRYARIR